MWDPDVNEHVRRRHAVLGSALFLVLAPGLAAGALPVLITGWEVDERLPDVVRGLGAVIGGLGIAFLLHTFARFALEGRGTPAPVAPTERLVVGGVYRFVRNPMYLAVLSVILGQALYFGSAELAGYGAVLAIAFVIFVRLYEEPTLEATYGAEYERYRAAVPGWIPRLRPWRG
jgi:protein-S-isoprenylcysteine O-methyltransferase Ste14